MRLYNDRSSDSAALTHSPVFSTGSIEYSVTTWQRTPSTTTMTTKGTMMLVLLLLVPTSRPDPGAVPRRTGTAHAAPHLTPRVSVPHCFEFFLSHDSSLRCGWGALTLLSVRLFPVPESNRALFTIDTGMFQDHSVRYANLYTYRMSEAGDTQVTRQGKYPCSK